MSEEVSEECNYITALHQIHHITSNENSLMVNTDHPCNTLMASQSSFITVPKINKPTFTSNDASLEALDIRLFGLCPPRNSW